MGALQQDLSLGGDADFGAGPGDAHGAELDTVDRHRRGESAVLGLAIDLAHVDAERHVPLDEIGRDRRGAGRGAAGAVEAHRALDVVEHEEIGDPEQQAKTDAGPPAGDAALGHACADRERPVVGEPSRTRGIPHPEGDGRVQLLPDPRHREEECRSDFAEVVRHGVDALGEVDGGPGSERIEHADRALGDVAEREERELLVAFPELGDVIGVVDLEQDVAVTQHRSLRRSRRARRVDQDRQIVGPSELDQALVGARILRLVTEAQLEQLVERHHLLVLEGVKPLEVEDDDLHELGAVAADLEDLVELLLVGGEEEAGAAVVDDVFDLPRRVRRVDPVGDAADRERPEIGVEPLGAVVGHDRDDVAVAQTERDQPEPDVPRPLAVLVPADGSPDAQLLLAHGHPGPALAHDVAKELRQGVLAEDGGRSAGRHRHVFFLFQRRVPRTPDSFIPR